MPDGGDPIEVVPYDQRWEESFVVSERELRVALAPFVVEIEHIGSTAVPGLAAKPVIDIQVGVRTLEDGVEIVSAVESLGYEFEDELPDRRYFRRWVDGSRSHQVHLVERSNTEWWDRHVRFRDWLGQTAARPGGPRSAAEEPRSGQCRGGRLALPAHDAVLPIACLEGWGFSVPWRAYGSATAWLWRAPTPTARCCWVPRAPGRLQHLHLQLRPGRRP